MLILITGLFFLFFPNLLISQDKSIGRYKIKENNKYGFIDKYGNRVIKPEYYEVRSFTEGLAAVRKKDKYHYINLEGEKVIEPLFDYAENFKNGIARVYVKGKPFLIDYEGNILFQHDFEEISNFEGGRCIVKTKDKNVGLIGYDGAVIIEPKYKAIRCVSETGRFVVREDRYDRSIFLVSNKGEIIVPKGRYSEIGKFNNGYAIVKRKKVKKELGDSWFWYEPYGVIDYYGKEVFLIDIDEFYPKSDIVNNVFIGEIRGDHFYIDSAGNHYFKEKECDDVTPFIENRAFIRYGRDYQWKLVNRNFEIVNDTFYEEIALPGFKKGIAAVEIEGEDGYEWIIIDRRGRLVQKFDEDVDEVIEPLTGNIFVVDNWSKCNGQYILIDDQSKQIYNECFDSAKLISRKEGIIEVKTGALKKYINFEGEVIWEEKEDNSFKILNIDFKTTNPCVPNREKITLNKQGVQNKKAKIVLLTSKKDTLTYNREKLFAQVVRIQNRSNDTLNFLWANGKPQLLLQAKDIDGQWKDITWIHWSSCGLGYDYISLFPFEAWDISYPLFEGNMDTMLRFKLVIRRKDRGEYYVYSDDFEGKINPGQFWRKVSLSYIFRFY